MPAGMIFEACILIDNINNKIMFKRTRSLSNAVCFKHDNNVCACAVSASILFPVVNLSLKMDSATLASDITFTWKVSPFDAAFCLAYFGDLSLSMSSFDRIITSS